MAQADIDAINGYTRDLLLDGYSVNGVDHPGIGKVVEENQKRIGALSAAVASLGNTDALASALAAKLPADSPVTTDQLVEALKEALGSLNDQPSA